MGSLILFRHSRSACLICFRQLIILLIGIPSLAVAFVSLRDTCSSCTSKEVFLCQATSRLTFRNISLRRRKHGSLQIGSSSSNLNDNNYNNNSMDQQQRLSAAARERREEERRRVDRINDAVIGKTSAKKGAKDFAIDPTVTQKQLYSNANEIEREIYIQTERGKTCLKMLNVKEASEAFDRVYQLKPSAYIYPAGIALFYCDEIYTAGECFAKNAQIFEARFGMRASEERLWRDACQLLLINTQTNNSSHPNTISSIPNEFDDDFSVHAPPPETRKIIRIARDMFDASIVGDYSRMILSRAKLIEIANSNGGSRRDPKLWKLSSWYFLGLHYDVLGRIEESKACMRNAWNLSSANKANAQNDIIHTLPMLHLSRRDWLKDDSYDSNDGHQLPVISNAEENIRDSIDKLLLVHIENALEQKGLEISGSEDKGTLKKRLFDALMADANINLQKDN